MLFHSCASVTQSNRKTLISGIPVVLSVSTKEGYSSETKLSLNFQSRYIHS